MNIEIYINNVDCRGIFGISPNNIKCVLSSIISTTRLEFEWIEMNLLCRLKYRVCF